MLKILLFLIFYSRTIYSIQHSLIVFYDEFGNAICQSEDTSNFVQCCDKFYDHIQHYTVEGATFNVNVDGTINGYVGDYQIVPLGKPGCASSYIINW